MKAVYEQHPAILLAVDRLEKLEQAKTIALTEIKYVPIGGACPGGQNGHMTGYQFSMETPCGTRLKIATFVLDSSSMTIDVCIGWEKTFHHLTGLAINPRRVRKVNDERNLIPRVPMNGELDEILKDTRGKDIALSFRYDLKDADVEAAAAMVVAFLIHRKLPAELRYM